MLKIKSLVPLSIILAVVISMTGCAQKFIHLDKKETVASLDFTKYQEKGFLITPNTYGGNYESIGLFYFTIEAEADFKSVKDERGRSFKQWVSKDIDTNEVLKLAYETAKNKGSDAITNFKIKNFTVTKSDGSSMFSIDAVEISGLLIKRK